MKQQITSMDKRISLVSDRQLEQDKKLDEQSRKIDKLDEDMREGFKELKDFISSRYPTKDSNTPQDK